MVGGEGGCIQTHRMNAVVRDLEKTVRKRYSGDVRARPRCSFYMAMLFSSFSQHWVKVCRAEDGWFSLDGFSSLKITNRKYRHGRVVSARSQLKLQRFNTIKRNKITFK